MKEKLMSLLRGYSIDTDIKQETKKFLDAVDVVCLDCHYLSEETCETCPVRKTVDELSDIKG